MHLDDAALEDVLAVELVEHLRLGCVHHVAEVHVGSHVAFEGDLHRFGDRHRCFASSECERHGARVGAERDAFGHTGVRVAADDDGPVVDCEVVEDLVNHVGERRVLVLWVATRDEAEVVHELHQPRDVLLGLVIPHRCGVAPRLVAAVDDRGDRRGRHHLQLLAGHKAGGVLRANDVDLDSGVGASVQRGAGGADGVAVEDLLDCGEALTLVGNFGRWGVDGWCVDAERLCSEGLELLAEDDGIGTAGLHELNLLWRERGGDVHQLFARFGVELLVLGVDREHRAGIDRVGLLEYGFAVFVNDEFAIVIEGGDPVLQIEANATGDVDGGQEDGRDAVRASDHWCNVDERNEGAGLSADPQRHVVHARHAR